MHRVGIRTQHEEEEKGEKSVIKAGSQCEKCIRPSDCDDDDGSGDNEEKRGGGGGGPLRRKHTSMIANAFLLGHYGRAELVPCGPFAASLDTINLGILTNLEADC